MPIHPFTSLSSFMHPDGGYDFKAYSAARRANGEECTRCGAFIVFNTGRLTVCGECVSFDEEESEVDSSHRVRCPHCRWVGNVAEDFDSDLYAESDHDVTCQSCGEDFVVSTSVSYSFKSPAIGAKGEDEEEDGV